MCAIVLVALAVASGLGISLFAGYEWSAAATQILPFVMLGIGVSDCFVVMRNFPTYRDGVSAEEACAKCFSLIGPSLFIANVTNASIFAIAVLTGMPIVATMAVQAVIIVSTNYIASVFILPALLCADYRRQAAGRADCGMLCVHVGTAPPPLEERADGVERNCLNRTFVPIYARFLVSTAGRVFAMVLFLVFIIAGAVGVTHHTELGLQLAEVAPAGTQMQRSLLIQDELFAYYNFYVGFYETDYSPREVQQGMNNIVSAVNGLSKVVPSSGISWITAFMLWGMPNLVGWPQNIDGRACDPSSSTTSGFCGQTYGCTVLLDDPSIAAGNIPFFPSH